LLFDIHMKNDKDLARMHTQRRNEEESKRFSKCEAFLPIIKLLRDGSEHSKRKGKRRNVKCKEICNGKEFQLLPIYVHLAFVGKASMVTGTVLN
jgi:hypothetical protein